MSASLKRIDFAGTGHSMLRLYEPLTAKRRQSAAPHRTLVAAAEAVGHAYADFAAEGRITEGVLIELVEKIGGTEINRDSMLRPVAGGQVKTSVAGGVRRESQEQKIAVGSL